ncbi:MAG: YqjF family protein [Haloferacaceae archaeon]
MALLTVAVRDALFVHWPVDADALAAHVPDPLAPEAFDGSGWVSAVALENRVSPGATALPGPFRGRFPQLNFRTYVTAGDDPGVYFFSLDSGRRLPAVAGRRLFGLPFHHARVRLTRRDDGFTFRSRRRGAPSAHFGARYHPTGGTYRAAPGTLDAFCVEHTRYYVPTAEDRRAGAVPSLDSGAVQSLDSGAGGADGREGVRVGTIERDPWPLRPVDATVRRNTLFEAADLPAPTADPVTHYSPGVEMAVEPLGAGPGTVD